MPSRSKTPNPFAGLSEDFPVPVPSSKLKKREGCQWLLHGCMAVGEVTLFSALWKVGKTTLLAHLLKSFQTGQQFCGLNCNKTAILYITEESEHQWTIRRDELGLDDSTYFINRPFRTKPRLADWLKFIDHLIEIQNRKLFQLIVFDTISTLWPVGNENDASEVSAALMPLHDLTDRSCITLVHHLKKTGGTEATGSRGSGALPAFADTILEMRRYLPNDMSNTKRLLTGYGRSDDTPKELVLDLTNAGYTAVGSDKESYEAFHTRIVIEDILGNHPGSDYETLIKNWPGDKVPTKAKLNTALAKGIEDGVWRVEGSGTRGNPKKYYLV